VYSLQNNVALDIMSVRDCDGELRVQVRERLYCNDTNMYVMSTNLFDFSDIFYWKRLRDGSDFSWKTSKCSEDKLQQFQQVLFGNTLVVDNDSFFNFLIFNCK
jgi:hypothetical protein